MDHYPRRDAQHPNMAVRQPRIALGILGPPGFEIMDSAIDFHGETGSIAIEVEHEAAERMLLPEMKSRKPAATKECPQDYLAISHLAP